MERPLTIDPPPLVPLRRKLLRGGAVVLMTVLAYIPVYSAGYIWDDQDYVTENTVLRQGWKGLRWIWTRPDATPQYYPLTHTSLWLEWQLWQDRPAGYHVVNVALHALSAVLLWRVLAMLDLRRAWLAAAVFAIHPVHVESVAWITERKNVLSGALYLSAMLLYLRGSRRRDHLTLLRPPGWPWYAGALVLFCGAVLSKTVAGSLPAALLLIVWWRSGKLPWRHALALSPMLIVAAVMGRFTAYLERTHVGAMGSDWDWNFIERCLIAGRAVWFYAWKMLAPINLMFIYPQWEIDAGSWWQYLFPIAAVVVVVALWMLRDRLGRGPLVAVLFFAGTVFPALGFVNIYPMRYSFVADHFQYLASIGLIVLGTELLLRIAQRHLRIVAALLLGLFGTLTYVQARTYHDVQILWETTIQRNPESWMVHLNLGSLRTDQGRFDEALHHFERSLAIKPHQFEAHMGLGRMWLTLGQADRALAEYRAAVQKVPHKDYPRLLLAQALEKFGHGKDAMAEYRRVLEIKPQMEPARLALAEMLLNRGRVEEAMQLYREGIEVFPETVNARVRLGDLLMQQGRFDEAIGLFEQALALQPHSQLIELRLAAARQNAAMQPR